MNSITADHPGRGRITPSSSRLRTRLIVLTAVFVIAFSVAVPAKAAYYLWDNWGAYLWWSDPYGGGGGLVLASDTMYSYPGTGDPYEYNTAEHFDNQCGCMTYVAAKSFMTDADSFPWYETSWDIDSYYANATYAHSTGYHSMGRFQAYVYNGWTTYFQDSPVLPN